MSKTTITIRLHENHAQLIVRYVKQTSMSYVEYALCGSEAFVLLTNPISVKELLSSIEKFKESERDVTKPYLDGFDGFFHLVYTVKDENILDYNVVEARRFTTLSGGRNINAGFEDANFKVRILLNLINTVVERDVDKLTKVMKALMVIRF